MGAFWFEKFVIFRHDSFGSDSKLMELQNFSQLNSRFLIYFGPNFFLQHVNGGFDVGVLCAIVQSPKPTFLLDEV